MKFAKKLFTKGVAIPVSATAMAMASSVQACSSDPYIGSICITAASFCPAGNYIEANGQILPITEYQALFSLLGDTYGGDGRSSFAVPDFRGRTPVGVGTGPGLNPVQAGVKRGIDYMTLTTQQLPAHTHAATFTPTGGGSASVQVSTQPATKPQAEAGDYLASNSPLGGSPKFIPEGDAGTTVALGGVSGGGAGTVQVANTGGNQAFPNFPPQQAVKYCIAYSGIYPSRP